MTATQPERLRPANGAGTEPTPARSPAADLDLVRQFVAALLTAGPTAPRRIRLTTGSTSLEVEWPDAAAAAPAPAPPAGPAAEAAPDGRQEVCAPLVGTFYSRPEPGQPPFVEVGSWVTAGQQIGIVEAMKLMNPVEADADGTVCEVLARDGDAVEYGQLLFRTLPLDES